jgi:serine-type D-Ala-D-Ala carboxypeptidase (penicillin-binding protein 5/6)
MKLSRLLASCLPLMACATALAAAPSLVTPPQPAATAAMPVPAPPTVPTTAYVLIDFDTGRVLAAQRAEERMEPASITKLMTGYIVFSAIRDKRLKLDEEVVISEHAWRAGGSASGGSTTFLQVGSRVPADVLIKGMIVQSGNDATIALAERIAGTESAFVEMMNQYAARLGLKNTHFDNSWGGPSPAHYSTAHDLALLGQALIRDFPEDYKIYSLREFVWNGIKQQNRNGLLARDPSVDGIKTGHTDSARYCLVSSARRNGMRLIATVLGSNSVKDREDASAALLNYGFTFYETVKLQPGGQMVLKPHVFKAAEDYVPVGPLRDVYVTIPRGQSGAVEKQSEVTGRLVAPLALHSAVGEMTVKAGGQVVAHVPLVTLAAAPEGGLFTRLVDTVRLWFN